MNQFKQLVYLALSMLLIHAGSAFADCSPSGSPPQTNTVLALPSNLSFKRNTPVGTIIYDSQWIASGSAHIYCTVGMPVTIGFAGSLTPVPGMPHVYETGVRGVGIKAAYSNTITASYHPADIDAVDNYAAWLLDSPPRQLTTTPTAATYTPAGVFRVQYIITGPLASGTMQLPSPAARTSYGSLATNIVTFTTTTVNIQSIGCRVLGGGDITVTLPTQPASSLSNVGDVSGGKDFSIDLSCDTGVAVSYKIDGTVAPGTDAATGVLATAGGANQAAGVGIQIRKRSTTTPVPLGSMVSYATTTYDNQLLNIPLTAYYYRTGTPVTGGAVNAVATFTMNYM
ncbi:fimbrial protein [Cupriavidus alkaliphilus]|uniref:fimbrial protein n=1 Tax=Cupriavidus alkaliphilus TaxID=942866 RepID=UPI000DDB3056|nr:fimbrial protein [Cupriavidus alkaliphilus]MBB3013283.1 type 1 fimbria pilin [Cupriavidus alkaliphilus]